MESLGKTHSLIYIHKYTCLCHYHAGLSIARASILVRTDR